jgi:outer membrane lipoprotein-sorting protein
MREVSKWVLVAVVCVGLGVVAIAPAVAQTAAKEEMPTVDQIIDKYVQAIGGKEAYQKITSRVAKGTFEMAMMGGDSTTEMYQKAPNKMYSITVSPQGDFKRGFNGTVGWQDNPMVGLVDVTGSQLTDMKRGADFYGDVKLKELYPKRTLKGKESVSGHDAYVVELTPSEGSAQTWYFDVDSGLAVRVQSTTETDNGTVDVDTLLSDYREVDGIKFPCNIHQSLGQFDFTIKFDDVKQNVPIDDKIFDKPAQ